MHSLTEKAAISVKWSALAEIVTRTATPVTFVILARLLTPTDFGLVATAMIVISFSQMFWDAGLSKALIQTNESSEDVADVVFWTNLVLGFLVYGILLLTAPLIAEFFKSPNSVSVLRVLGIQIVISSLTSVHQTLFVKNLNFRQLFWVKLCAAFIPALASIPLSFLGYGAWALVTGSLMGQLLTMVLFWSKSPWRPKRRFDSQLARKLLKFGIWVVGESFASWLIIWGDNLLVGKFLGIHDLGVYRTGWMLVTLIFGLFLNPFLPVLYPVFSRLQDDIPALTDAFHKANRVVIALALPMGVGLWFVSSDLSFLLFGEKWQGLGFVMSIIGLMHGIAWLVGINSDLYRAMGRPDVNTKLLFISILYYMPLYFVAAKQGIEVFTYTRLVVALIAMPIHVFLCRRMIGVSYFYLFQEGKNIFLATLSMAVIVICLKFALTSIKAEIPLLLILMAIIATGIVFYIGTLWFLDRSFILQTRDLLRRAAFT